MKEMETIGSDLERRIRGRGVRVSERLALLKLLLADGGEAAVRARVDELKVQMEARAQKVRGLLR